MACNATRTLESAADLPKAWDRAASGNTFLESGSLLAIERANPCGQAYHMAGSDDSPSICVTYRLALDALAFGRGSLKISVTMVGIPCSVSSPGYGLADGSRDDMIRHLLGMDGVKLILNSDDAMALPGFHLGDTLSTCRLAVEWPSFEDYVGAMRSHYRYRTRQALKRWRPVSSRTLRHNSEFGSELHELYINVFRRSRYKLERLGIEFFRTYPARVDAFEVDGKPIGFTQMVRDGDRLVFMFGGLDYTSSARYDTYLNCLLHVIRTGIESGCLSIDLGQTAEEVKSRLGCELVPKQFHVAHSNRTAHRVLGLVAPLLSYHIPERGHRVFK